MESKTTSLPVIKCITNYTVIRQKITEYIRLSESMIGKGKFFSLVVKDDAMIDMGIFPGDYVIVKEVSNIRDNDIVVILFNGLDIVRKIHIKEDKTVLFHVTKTKNNILISFLTVKLSKV